MKICADMHTHTIASTHAYSTITENTLSAKENGMMAVAMTDHAPKMWDAPHIWHFHNLKVLPREINDVFVVRGAEADIIDRKGNIDLEGISLKYIEWIVASMHGSCYESGTIEENTQAYIEIAKNPAVDCIGHCSTNEFLFNYEEGIRAFKEYGKIVELNESSLIYRKGALENAIKVIKICKELKVPICINSDAHYCSLIGKLPTAIQMVNDLDFPEELIINANWDRLKDHINSKHPDALL